MKELPPPVMSGAIHPVTHCHIPEELNFNRVTAKFVFFIWSDGNTWAKYKIINGGKSHAYLQILYKTFSKLSIPKYVYPPLHVMPR